MKLTQSIFKQEAVIICLKKLFSDNWFNVSNLNSAASLAEITIPEGMQKIFQAIHCVQYNTMSKEFRADLAENIHDIFKEFFELESNQIQFSEIIKEIECVKR